MIFVQNLVAFRRREIVSNYTWYDFRDFIKKVFLELVSAYSREFGTRSNYCDYDFKEHRKGTLA